VNVQQTPECRHCHSASCPTHGRGPVTPDPDCGHCKMVALIRLVFDGPRPRPQGRLRRPPPGARARVLLVHEGALQAAGEGAVVNVQHCQMLGRGKCGRCAVAWVRVRYRMYAGVSTNVLAACPAHLGDHEIVEAIKRPEVMR